MNHVERAEAAGSWWSVCIYGAALLLLMLAVALWPQLVAEHRRRMERVRRGEARPLRLSTRWQWLSPRDPYAPCARTRGRIDPERCPPITLDYPGGTYQSRSTT